MSPGESGLRGSSGSGAADFSVVVERWLMSGLVWGWWDGCRGPCRGLRSWGPAAWLSPETRRCRDRAPRTVGPARGSRDLIARPGRDARRRPAGEPAGDIAPATGHAGRMDTTAPHVADASRAAGRPLPADRV